MPRGRHKKLDTLKLLEGRRNASVEEVTRAYGEPFIPDHLNEDAQEAMEMILSSMPPGVYAKLDGMLIADFAVWWAWHKAAVHRMSAPDFQPVVVGGRGHGEVISPWFRLLNLASARMQSLSARLGLDPIARQHLSVPAGNRNVSKFAGLIGQNGSSPSLDT
jgi:phage terminase small subunit